MESKRCCFILPLFGQGPGYLIFKYKTKTLASFCIQLLVALSKILSLSHVPRKWRKRIELQNRVGPGRRRSGGACISIIFNTSSGIPAPGIPCVWSIVTVYFNTYVNHLASHAQSKKHVEQGKPSYTVPFDALTFDILTQETVFQEMGGLRYLKTEMLTDSPLLSSRRFSLVRYFATRSLFSFVDTDREPGSWLFCLTIQRTWTINQMYITGPRFQNSEFVNWKKEMNQTYHNGICHKHYRSAFECCL